MNPTLGYNIDKSCQYAILHFMDMNIQGVVKKHYGDRQAMGVEDICPLTDTDLFDFRLREIVDDYVYYIEMLVPVVIKYVRLTVIVEQDYIKISRKYNQNEIINILSALQEKAEQIIKQTNAYD